MLSWCRMGNNPRLLQINNFTENFQLKNPFLVIFTIIFDFVNPNYSKSSLIFQCVEKNYGWTPINKSFGPPLQLNHLRKYILVLVKNNIYMEDKKIQSIWILTSFSLYIYSLMLAGWPASRARILRTLLQNLLYSLPFKVI